VNKITQQQNIEIEESIDIILGQHYEVELYPYDCYTSYREVEGEPEYTIHHINLTTGRLRSCTIGDEPVDELDVKIQREFRDGLKETLIE